MKFMKQNTVIIGMLLLFCITTSAAHAARLYTVTEKTGHQTTKVSVVLDTDSELINALDGTISYMGSGTLTNVSDGNSLISLWITKPNYNETNSLIEFSGITPGGIRSTEARIFSFEIDDTQFDAGDLELIQGGAYLHDGVGTKRQLSYDSLYEMHTLTSTVNDTDPPETFTPVIAQDPEAYDGKYFLSFNTQDKGSGIQKYRVREGVWGFYRDATSPYILKNQDLSDPVYIEAIDLNGNTTVTVLNAPSRIEEVIPRLLLICSICIGFLVLILFRRYLQKRTDSHKREH